MSMDTARLRRIANTYRDEGHDLVPVVICNAADEIDRLRAGIMAALVTHDAQDIKAILRSLLASTS